MRGAVLARGGLAGHHHYTRLFPNMDDPTVLQMIWSERLPCQLYRYIKHHQANRVDSTIPGIHHRSL
jgi:hypothetical protein